MEMFEDFYEAGKDTHVRRHLLQDVEAKLSCAEAVKSNPGLNPDDLAPCKVSGSKNQTGKAWL